MTSEEKRRIVEALDKKGVQLKCPMCGNAAFLLAAGYVVHSLHDTFSKPSLNGRAVPTVLCVCDRCGFVSQHAIGMLEMIELGDNAQNKKE